MTEVAVSTNAAIVSPCWSPDGKRLAFATVVQNARRRRRARPAQQDVWTVNADGDEPPAADRRQRHEPVAVLGRRTTASTSSATAAATRASGRCRRPGERSPPIAERSRRPQDRTRQRSGTDEASHRSTRTDSGGH